MLIRGFLSCEQSELIGCFICFVYVVEDTVICQYIYVSCSIKHDERTRVFDSEQRSSYEGRRLVTQGFAKREWSLARSG